MVDASDVRNDEAKERFELEFGGHLALAAYRREGDTLSFIHTEVPEELEGQGVGKALIEGALTQVREQGLKILPLCSFVRHYVETHPEAQDLVAER
jgi:predicted GNAT family acetyltransferase